MENPKAEPFATYRCPVCGHGDSVELDGAAAGRRIVCSYCAAQLEVGENSPRAGRVTVRVADVAVSG
jgi:transcription elongation factor Elf1